MLFEAGFVVEEVDLGGSSALPEDDDTLGFGFEMRHAFESGDLVGLLPCLSEGGLGEKGSQRPGAEAGRGFSKQLSAGDAKVTFEKWVHGYSRFRASSRLRMARQTLVRAA